MPTMRLPAVILVTFAVGALALGCSSEGSSGQTDDRPAPPSAASGDSSSSSASTAPAAPVEPSTSSDLFVQGRLDVPAGTGDGLEVVLVGTQTINLSGAVPVAVRNNSATSLRQIEATATARSADGTLAGTGASQGFKPAVIKPGEWAIGYVFFGSELPLDATFEVTATGEEEVDFGGSVDVTPSEVTVVPSDLLGQQVVGLVTNNSGADVSGPVSVLLACFDAPGTAVTSMHISYADNESIPDGGTSGFSVDLFEDPCPNFVLGASGYDF